MFWLYPQYSLGLNSTLEPSSVVIVVSREFNRHKRFRAFPQPASVPRKRPFPESFRVFARPSIYPFVKAKPVFTVILKWKWLPWILSDEAVNGFSKKNADGWNYVLKKESSCVLTNVFTISSIYNISELTMIFGIVQIYWWFRI